MTSSILKPLSAEEQAAWAVHNATEERMRAEAFAPLTFREKLQILEQRSRGLSKLRESAHTRLAAQKQ